MTFLERVWTEGEILKQDVYAKKQTAAHDSLGLSKINPLRKER